MSDSLPNKVMICDSVSIQGFSHKKINKECQDNSISWCGDGYCGIIVCDGHGGDKYIRSAYGSSSACEVGKAAIETFMEKFVPGNDKQINASLEQLEKSIVSAWYAKIDNDIPSNPISNDPRFELLSETDQKSLEHNPVKAYGSTFIAAVKTDVYCFVLKLGDGNTVFLYSDGDAKMPEELSDDECQFNFTTSLCNNDAALSFRHYFERNTNERQVSGVVLTSDGVINCYKTEKNYISFVENVFFGYGEDGIETAKADLIPALDQLSERGSGDDLSVAIIREPFSSMDKILIKRKREKEETELLLNQAKQTICEKDNVIKSLQLDLMSEKDKNSELHEKLKSEEREKDRIHEELLKLKGASDRTENDTTVDCIFQENAIRTDGDTETEQESEMPLLAGQDNEPSLSVGQNSFPDEVEIASIEKC